MSLATAPAPTSAPALPTSGSHREVHTLFGTLAVDRAHVLTFAEGLLGFPTQREWVVLGSDRPQAAWLQSVETPELALLLVDPFAAFPGFSVLVPGDAQRALRAVPTDDVAVFAPVTLGAEGAPATANLCGLILINWRTRSGVQCVIDGGAWSVRSTVPAGVLD